MAAYYAPSEVAYLDRKEEKPLYAKDEKSGWTIEMRPLSDYNFERLNHDILGVPIYYNGDRVWPLPAKGITLLWGGTDPLR